MKIDKRESRISAIILIYMMEVNKVTPDEVATMFFSDEEINVEGLNYATSVYQALENIDSIIEKALVNYSITRLNLVDLAIIRLASYEMIKGLPANIAINEALEITKIYSDLGDNAAVSFNNRLLDNIKKLI